MKTSILITAVIFFAALMGCSDSVDLNDPLNADNHSIGQTIPAGDNDNREPELIWEMDELTLKATDESFVENESPFVMSPHTNEASYLVVFQGSTNADNFSNGYSPLVKITRDEKELFRGTNMRTINGYNEIRLDNTRFNVINFYIALFRANEFAPSDDDRQPGEPCYLELSDMKIYRLN